MSWDKCSSSILIILSGADGWPRDPRQDLESEVYPVWPLMPLCLSAYLRSRMRRGKKIKIMSLLRKHHISGLWQGRVFVRSKAPSSLVEMVLSCKPPTQLSWETNTVQHPPLPGLGLHGSTIINISTHLHPGRSGWQQSPGNGLCVCEWGCPREAVHNPPSPPHCLNLGLVLPSSEFLKHELFPSQLNNLLHIYVHQDQVLNISLWIEREAFK